MLKDEVKIQGLKVDRRLITFFKPFVQDKEIQSCEMNICFGDFGGPYSKLWTAN